MRKPLRLLPLVLFAGALMLTVRAGDLWTGLTVGTTTAAETPPEDSALPAQAPPGETATAEAPTAESGAAQDPAATPAAPEAEAVAAEPAPATGEPAPEMTDPAPAAPLASAAAPVTAEEPHAPAEAADAGEPAMVALGDPFDLTDEEIDVLQSLAERREQLEARERALAQREALLAAAEQRIDQKLAELKGLQQTIAGLVKANDEQREAQMKSLVKIYESMKPKDAAQIFDQLEMEVLLDVIGRMKEQKAATVLALVDPARAKDITLELAERSKMPLPE